MIARGAVEDRDHRQSDVGPGFALPVGPRDGKSALTSPSAGRAEWGRYDIG
jgi:hypothetical protein